MVTAKGRIVDASYRRAMRTVEVVLRLRDGTFTILAIRADQLTLKGRLMTEVPQRMADKEMGRLAELFGHARGRMIRFER